MQLKKIPMIFLGCFHIAGAMAQTGKWEDPIRWRLYSAQGNSAFKISPADMKKEKSIVLDKDSAIYFFQKASALDSHGAPLWMGSWLVSFEDSAGALHKIDVSMYGGFFYDEAAARYFKIPASLKNDWLDFFSRAYEKIEGQ